MRFLAAWILSVVLVACGRTEMGVDYDGERLSIIDMHLHPGEWEGIPPRTQDLIATRFPFPLGLNATATSRGVLSSEGIVAQLDKGGVASAGIFAVYAPRSVGVATNELVASYLAEYPERFHGFASLRVDDWANQRDTELQRLDDALSIEGMVGVKLAHAHQRFRMDDPAYYGIYEVAARHAAPIYLHTGTSPFPGAQTAEPYCNPRYLEDAIASHPDTVFIIGHLGHDAVARDVGFLDEALDLAARYANVYLEPSALAKTGDAVTEDNMYIAMQRIQALGLERKVIYGSDGPQSPGFVGDNVERTVAVMQALGFEAAEAQAILSGTFRRVVLGEDAP